MCAAAGTGRFKLNARLIGSKPKQAAAALCADLAAALKPFELSSSSSSAVDECNSSSSSSTTSGDHCSAVVKGVMQQAAVADAAASNTSGGSSSSRDAECAGVSGLLQQVHLNNRKGGAATMTSHCHAHLLCQLDHIRHELCI